MPTLENMQMYCLSCWKHTDNADSNNNNNNNNENVIREKPRSANCMVAKSRFLKQKSNKKVI